MKYKNVDKLWGLLNEIFKTCMVKMENCFSCMVEMERYLTYLLEHPEEKNNNRNGLLLHFFGVAFGFGGHKRFQISYESPKDTIFSSRFWKKPQWWQFFLMSASTSSLVFTRLVLTSTHILYDYNINIEGYNLKV